MNISLTEKGRLAAENEGRQNQEERLYEVLTEEEKEELRRILRNLVERWSFDYHGRRAQTDSKHSEGKKKTD